MSKPSDTQYFRPDLDVSVDFWCCTTPFQSNWQKSKLIASHPTLPFLLSCDEDQVLSIWNIATQQLIWQRSATLLIKECSGVSPISIFHHGTIGAQRFSKRSSERFHGLSRNLDYSVNKAETVGTSDTKSKEMSFGDVKSIDFADTVTLTFNGSFHNSKDVSLENRIVVLFDQAIIVVNYSTHQYSLICSNDLMGKKPTSVEFLDEHNCAIGCNDGTIRIWNLKKSSMERAFGNTKSEIMLIKSIPVEMYDMRNCSFRVFYIIF
jgi:WD40 repeat protein